MSVSRWAYDPEICDGGGCPGDCDLCNKPNEMDDDYEQDSKLREWMERRALNRTKKQKMLRSRFTLSLPPMWLRS